MGNIMLVLMFATSFLASIQAQDVRFGLKAGINSANASEASATAITSFHVGGMMEALYADTFALQPEILYSQQGFEMDTETAKERYTFSYINIPLMFKYVVVKGIILEAGPQIGYLNTAKLERHTTEGNTEIDIKDAMSDNDFSLNIGLGFQTRSGWILNGRYNWGLTNLVKSGLDRQFKVSVLQVSIGYLF